jgi:pimeloyl-ACP methyl ester carboxylesterase
MTTYVLVHGATAGGWQMRGVAQRLRETGAEVFTPTLTGLGERSHLANPEVDLETHIQDVLAVLQYEDLYDVILVGKSYSGIVVTAVVDRAPERIRHLVYLDALVPENGQSFLDIVGPDIAQRMQAAVDAHGAGWRLPVDRTAEPRLADHPFKTMQQPVMLKNPSAMTVPRTYILCTQKPPGITHTRVTTQAAQRAQALGWGYRELAADHDAEQTMPQAVAALLLELAYL